MSETHETKGSAAVQGPMPVAPPDALDDYVPVGDLAEFFGASIISVNNALRGKGCLYYKIGMRVWYRRSEVAAFLKTRALTLGQG